MSERCPTRILIDIMKVAREHNETRLVEWDREDCARMLADRISNPSGKRILQGGIWVPLGRDN